MGAVLSFLLPCSIQTRTRQRLIHTRSPINLDLFRYFGGGGPSHRLQTNLSYTDETLDRIKFGLQNAPRFLCYVPLVWYNDVEKAAEMRGLEADQ